MPRPLVEPAGAEVAVGHEGAHLEGLAVEHRGFRTQLRRGTVEAVDLNTIVAKGANGRRIGGPDRGFINRAPELLIGAWPGDSGFLGGGRHARRGPGTLLRGSFNRAG